MYHSYWGEIEHEAMTSLFILSLPAIDLHTRRALMGAGLFITTVVLATVLLVTKGRNYNIGKNH